VESSGGGAVRAVAPLREGTRPHRRRRKAFVSLTALVIIVAGSLIAVVAMKSSTPQNVVYPGTLTGPMARVDLRVVECKSSYGIPGEDLSPVVARHVRVTIPKTLVGKVSLYSDKFRSIEPMLAPSGWKCTAGVGADGNGSITAVPKGRGVGGEQVSYSFVPACSGCAFVVYCPFVSAAMRTAAQEGSCPMPSDKQRDTVVYQTTSLSAGTIFIEDPPGSFGSLTPYRKPQSQLYVSAGYLSYTVIGENSTQLLACTLPSSEVDICRASWKMGFADHEVPRYTYADTTTTTTSPSRITQPNTTTTTLATTNPGPSMSVLASKALTYWNGREKNKGATSTSWCLPMVPRNWVPGYQVDCFIEPSSGGLIGEVFITATKSPSPSEYTFTESTGNI
jgi:hypothetical protein